MNTRPSRQAAAAFTLVELLTVIAIIGILAGIIIPVVGRVRSQAKAAQCVSNLREIGKGMITYATDNKDYFPPSRVTGISGPDNNWLYYLAPYVGHPHPETPDWEWLKSICRQKGVLLCPENINVSQDLWLYSYKMNIWFRKIPYGDATSIKTGVRLSSITNPSRAFTAVDGATGNGSVEFTSSGEIAYVHNGKANCLFADGHVRPNTKEFLDLNWDALCKSPLK
ncbi:prepilin-type N-terminal cleavage/methylation domain-containing protein [Opitutaceae bacterium TAV1]|nr:prepilin-type N-terminal cleavage/methylation domain-containing protein [Opitutaceae bacterium TAV1]